VNRESFQPEGVAVPGAPYSPVVASGDLVVTAGQVGFDEQGRLVGDGIREQTRQNQARFAQFSNYTIEVRRPAPSLSQHTGEILKTELGLSPTEIQALFVHGIIIDPNLKKLAPDLLDGEKVLIEGCCLLVIAGATWRLKIALNKSKRQATAERIW